MTLVGRTTELRVLRQSLERVVTGERQIVLVAGEPGIGKTSIVRNLVKEAAGLGAVAMYGACFEGDGQPLLAPWVQAIGSNIAVSDSRYVSDLAPVLSRVVPGAGTKRSKMSLPGLSATEERFRLYDAMTQYVVRVADDAPTVVVLDDLHWADADSLALLAYISRSTSDKRIFLVGTYRQTEIEPAGGQTLSDVLAELARQDDYIHMSLHGLDRDEVSAYLTALGGRRASEQLAAAIHEETSGNPFFIRELFHHLNEDGRSDPIDASNAELAPSVPESVRHVISRRLARLREPTARMLAEMSVFTRGFDFPLVRALTGMEESELLRCLDEALASGLVVEQPGDDHGYNFAHALVRHTLEAQPNLDRRARWHRRAAEALEKVYAGRENDQAAELAAQYHASRSLPGAERGLPFALAAAAGAAAAGAFDRAAALLRLARDLARDEDAATRAEVLRRLALAEAQALMLDAATESAIQALAAAEEAASDQEVVIDFLTLMARILKEGGAPRDRWERLLDEGSEFTSDRKNLRWARLVLLKDPVDTALEGAVNIGLWTGFDRDAVATARTDGDEDDYARTLEPYEWRSADETRRILALTRGWSRPSAVIRALDAVVRDLLHRHDAPLEGIEVAERMLDVSRRAGSIPGQVEALVQLSFGHGVTGRLDHQETALDEARNLVSRLGPTHRLRWVVDQGGTGIQAFLRGAGDWRRLANSTTAFIGSPKTGRTPLGFVFSSVAILAHAFGGDRAETSRLLRLVTPCLIDAPTTAYHKATTVDLCGWAIWELGASDLAAPYQELAQEMLDGGHHAPLMGAHALTVARLGSLIGDPNDYRDRFDEAREDLERAGKRALRAITDADEAKALVRWGSRDHGRIEVLLEQAISTFGELGMMGWEHRALRLRASLATWNGLTPREIGVLRLVAGARTNKEIAGELFISVATVERHVANIYRKIGARSRVEATSYALREGLA
jgi:DNA-binding CsgD family transcriptional regulator